MKDNKFKKLVLPIGAVALAALPFVSVVSCSNNDNNKDTSSNNSTYISQVRGEYEKEIGLTITIFGDNLPLSIANYFITYRDHSNYYRPIDKNIEFLLSEKSTSTEVTLYRPYDENDSYLLDLDRYNDEWVDIKILDKQKNEYIWYFQFPKNDLGIIRQYEDSKKRGFYFNDNGIITKYQPTNFQSSSVTIPETLVDFSSGKEIKIKGIAKNVFANKNIENLYFEGNNIEWIGEGAFLGNNIRELQIHSSVKMIAKDSFKNNQIGNLNLGGSIVIGQNSFENNLITNITIPENVEIIDVDAFLNNINLSSVWFESNSSLKFLSGFKDTSINEIDIPDSVEIIGKSAFENCKINSLTIKNNVHSIEESAFNNSNIKNLKFEDSINIKKIGKSVFKNNQLTSVTIPNSVTEIDDHAFENNQLTSIAIPNSVTNIGSFAFEYNKLTSVVIPNSVTEIDDHAFKNNKLTSVDIPESISSIFDFAFARNQISELTFLGINPVLISKGSFNSNSLSSVILPIGSSYITNHNYPYNSFDSNVKITFKDDITN